MILLPIFSIILLVPLRSSSSDENVSESAEDALFSAFSGSLNDALFDLNVFGPESEQLMKTLSRLAPIAKQNLDPKSTEYKALEKFKNRTDELWKLLKWISEFSERENQFKWPEKSNYFKSTPTDTHENWELFETLHRSISWNDLDVFNQQFSNHYKAFSTFLDEVLKQQSVDIDSLNRPLPCNLRSLVQKSFFDYSAIKQFAIEMKNQLIDLSFTAGVCAGVVYEEQPSFIEKYIEEMTNEVTFISTFTSKWLNDSLTLSWPSVHNQILKEQIMRNVQKDGNFDKSKLKVSIENARPILKNTGMPYHDYEILIVKAPEKRHEHYFEGTSNHCSVNKDVFGFDTMIGKFRLDPSNDYGHRRREYPKELTVAIENEMG
ncbi:hypothetical protein CAEBREN_12895 [Caenorhabditis brenneri]|uniref:Uncharacterized protein n=1 Tax=Caenorhabditis brenneri TaxID=135651 RepID=G0MZY6_CAEBE|nr:hypothetical protein CAEBREN_12895 [Caenorhabditis brenneri]